MNKNIVQKKSMCAMDAGARQWMPGCVMQCIQLIWFMFIGEHYCYYLHVSQHNMNQSFSCIFKCYMFKEFMHNVWKNMQCICEGHIQQLHMVGQPKVSTFSRIALSLVWK